MKLNLNDPASSSEPKFLHCRPECWVSPRETQQWLNFSKLKLNITQKKLQINVQGNVNQLWDISSELMKLQTNRTYMYPLNLFRSLLGFSHSMTLLYFNGSKSQSCAQTNAKSHYFPNNEIATKKQICSLQPTLIYEWKISKMKKKKTFKAVISSSIDGIAVWVFL